MTLKESLEEAREEVLTGLRKCPVCHGTGKVKMPTDREEVFVEVGCKRCKETGKVKIQTIEIDCQPGFPRPGDLIDGVIEGTGLPKRESVGRLFGNWTWDYTDIDPEIWEKANPILKERLKKLYEDGVARYVSW